MRNYKHPENKETIKKNDLERISEPTEDIKIENKFVIVHLLNAFPIFLN